MFELSVACKYLLPRRRQLSVSVISLISIFVIALVVWLIVVFFSVTNGLEKSWIQKLTALTAPVRLTPKDAYYQSYYYQIDSISEQSDYGHKTIGEKLEASQTDPYDSSVDEEIPASWPRPDRDANGQVKDLVKLAYASIDELKGVPGLQAKDFELSFSHLYLRLIRDMPPLPYSRSSGTTRSALSYPAYLGQFDETNADLSRTFLPLQVEDFNHLLAVMGTQESFEQEEGAEEVQTFDPAIFHKRLENFFQTIQVRQLKTPDNGWNLPKALWPSEAKWTVIALVQNQRINRLIIPSDIRSIPDILRTLDEYNLQGTIAQLNVQPTALQLTLPDQTVLDLPLKMPLLVAAHTRFSAELLPNSLSLAKRVGDILFHVQLNLQGVSINGIVPYKGLQLGEVEVAPHLEQALWVHPSTDQGFILPQDPDVGEGVLLPKSFREAGVLVGDRGYLTYLAPTTSILQEQKLPIYVAGFYDPGIIPIGGKFILANRDLTTVIRSAQAQDEKMVTNGINVRFNDLEQAEEVKAQLQKIFKAKGIDRYWSIETYREYEFTKGLIQELQSQKNLFTLIAIVIIVVACSNIISMLIILVNDKKTEIGILRSMGASSKSIALIFGLAGGLIGIVGSVIGISAAILTLRHLPVLIGLISRFQGHDMFNAAFYGGALPQELSYEALAFVLGATMIISLLAGIVPAIKACLLKPSSILRST